MWNNISTCTLLPVLLHTNQQVTVSQTWYLYTTGSVKTRCVTTVQMWPTLKGIQRQGNLIGTWACCPWLLKGLYDSVVRARNRPRSPTLLTRYAAFRTFGAIFKIGSVQLRRWSPEQFSWFKQLAWNQYAFDMKIIASSWHADFITIGPSDVSRNSQVSLSGNTRSGEKKATDCAAATNSYDSPTCRLWVR